MVLQREINLPSSHSIQQEVLTPLILILHPKTLHLFTVKELSPTSIDY